MDNKTLATLYEIARDLPKRWTEIPPFTHIALPAVHYGPSYNVGLDQFIGAPATPQNLQQLRQQVYQQMINSLPMGVQLDSLEFEGVNNPDGTISLNAKIKGPSVEMITIDFPLKEEDEN